jgi:hypothetical protein
VASNNLNLDDIRKIVREETLTVEDVRRVVKEESLTLEDVRTVVSDVIDQKVPQMFVDFWDTNLSPALEDIDDQFEEVRGSLDRIESEVKGIRRTARKHSADIAELQAAKGL